jgi:CBS domain-containing protein
MRASNVMTTEVISVSADTPLRDVARVLLEHGISAVPVVDADGSPVGMVSEGDLLGRDEVARLQRRDWWLTLIADDAAPDDLSRARTPDRTARDVMSAPIVTVAEGTDLAEVTRLLAQHHIKRVPVMKDGYMVGIVSRADLLRGLTSVESDTDRPPPTRPDRGFLLSMFGEYRRPAWEVVPPKQAVAPEAATLSSDVNASAFRALIEDFQADKAKQRDAADRSSAEHTQQLTMELIDTHVTEETWRSLLHHARQAAEAGEKECLLLRFPNALCSDGGREIDVRQETWPATLRGEAAELYLRWERELKGRGFHLAARVMEYPGGMPGDIGLYLVWGEAT